MKKILISSDPHGRFDLLLPKVTQLNNKNKFDFMIIVGVVCPSNSAVIFKDIINKKNVFPIPTYFIDNSELSYALSVANSEGFEMAHNFYYLGNIGYKQIMGIKFAYFSGNLNCNGLKETHQNNPFLFSKQQAKQLTEKLQGKQTDILLTNQWCQQYNHLQGTNPQKNQTISQICYQLSPRYHISAGGTKYLRLPPFRGRKNNPTHFINVAQIKQALPKDKYLVAIQIQPNIPQVLQNINQNILMYNAKWDVVQSDSVNLTAQGILLKQQQKKSDKLETKTLDKDSFIMFEGFPQHTPNAQITQFLQKWGDLKEIQVFKKLKGNKKSGIVRFKDLKDAEICVKDSGKYTLYQSRIKFQIKQQNEKYNIKQCFLCQGNQNFDKSLLVKKAKFCYICLDKGPIIQNHFQIVPINHVSTTTNLQAQEQQQISQFRRVSQIYFNNKNITLICIERYMNLSDQINHVILHCIPVNLPEDQTIQRFKETNYQNKHGFQELNENNRDSKNDSPYYILFQINNKKFIKHVDRKDKRFEQGRQIICEILDKPERLNWRDCEIKQQQIRKSLQQIKQIFE